MKNRKNNNKKMGLPENEFFAVSSKGLPDNVPELINEYGTYEIQATADTDNQYPAIAQGFTPEAIETDRIKRKREGTREESKV